MTSIFRSFLIASAVFAAFAAVRPSLHAQGFGGAFTSFFSDDEEDDNNPVDVSASVADIYLGRSAEEKANTPDITLLGDVIVDRKDTKITCNKMEIFLKDKDKSEEPGQEKTDKTDKTDKETKPAGTSAEVKPAGTAAEVKPAGTVAKSADADKETKDKDDDGMSQNISKLICTGDVVYRQQKKDKPGEDSLALANKGDYDDTNGTIIMTGGHMNPQEELPRAIYEDIVRVVGKDMVKEYPIMKQGTNWILGDKIEIFVKERNHMRVINPKVSSNKALSNN